jgi:hypothetical protein
MKIFSTLLLVSSIFISSLVSAQQISFPGAEGAGRLTTGGRGTPTTPTTVFEVTRLDDPSPTAPGTLRYAITNNSPVALYRTIVFRVSGTIHLTSRLSINRPNTTIAGQTAPGDGICVADYPVSLSANNVIVRFMRFRLGDKNQNQGMVNGSGDGDAFSGSGYKNIVIDHCTMSWSSDECFSIYGGDSTTVQWNILSEPLDYSYHFETGDTDFERHGYGGIWGGRRASFHHNLIAHVRGRAPRFDGSRNLAPYTPGQENVDFRNNVIYDWVDYNVNGGEGGNYNVVNNYYKYGPNTPSTSTKGVNRRNMVINPYAQTTSPVLPYGKYFLEGNYVDNSATVTADNWLGAAMNNGGLSDTNQAKVTTPFDIAPLNTQTATDAYNAVLEKAGAVLPKRDTLDERIVNDVRNRTGRIIDVQGGYPHGTPYPQTVNAWPTLNSTAAPADTDHDGMPDSWESANGLNPNDPADRNTYHANGYTMLENYLNGLTEVLPLTLLTFTAETAGKDVKAIWTTANEVNTKQFVVERSIDGRSFAAVGTIASKNTPQVNQYFFVDAKPVNGISYYRLKMVDKDGSFTYSAVVKITKTGLSILSVVPNPVTDKMVVSHAAPAGRATISIVGVDGRQVKQTVVQRGVMQSFLDLTDLQSGVYTIVFTNGTEKLSLQFIKQ